MHLSIGNMPLHFRLIDTIQFHRKVVETIDMLS